MNPDPNSPRTKRARKTRTTRPSVKRVETLARLVVTLGGGATILAVATICLFLVWVVVPMFRGAELAASGEVHEHALSAARPVHTGVDEYRQLSWTVFSDGALEVHALAHGQLLERSLLFDGVAPTCSAYNVEDGSLAFGFADGRALLGRVVFATAFAGESEVTPELRQLSSGESRVDGAGLVERTPEGQLRRTQLELQFDAPLELGTPLVAIDATSLTNGVAVCALTSEGQLTLNAGRKTTNLLTGEETLQLTRCVLPYRPAPSGAAPLAVKLTAGGDNVLAIWRDGRCVRYDARDFEAPTEAEVLDLVPEQDATVTALDFVIGKRTLIVGDSLGRVRGWFRIKPDAAETRDGARTVCGHEFALEASPVSALAPSAASRTFAIGYGNGRAHLVYMTTERVLGTTSTADGSALATLALAPRENALVARTADALMRWDVECEHPEVSLAGLFAPVWYENYPRAEHVWQSSSGTDDFEPKLGLIPLVFGTLKATLYSMLFGVPLALLAAIFSSEFLDKRLRVGVKSTIEVMASLPSVVLGFLSAIVIAPVVQGLLIETLTALYMLPVALLCGAYAWQLLPQRWSVRAQGWPRFVGIALMLPVGIAAALLLGPPVERLLFAGDIEAWLHGSHGSALGGWVFFLIPLGAASMALLSGRFVAPYFRRISRSWSRASCARLDLARFALSVVGTLALALAAGFALDSAGIDPRGGIVDTYVQRNALVVGFIMGFAIIPIIYTLAEDALTSVPEHLRLASLGAGATPWQTAVRVIVPTAASGLFSAIMVGLGRAVGETMIVLMAAGNTPLLEWNAFSGFRTLSANIAVELPEAVEGSTHYRTLFLAALTLFVMTFVVNTAAEIVRQRFRKRAFQL